MAQYVSVDITIGETSISQFSSLSVSQGIYSHHRFRLVCPVQAIDGKSGNLLNTSKSLIGGTLSLSINSVGSSGALQFSGVVTGVEAERTNGYTGDIIISGYSPTILLDDGANCAIWEEKTYKVIVQDVLSKFPQNLLQPGVSPTSTDTLPYTVQYGETAWAFVKRLSAQFGEWLYYDGSSLKIGAPQATKIALTYGSHLSRFAVAMQLQPGNFQMTGYDYATASVYTSAPTGIGDAAGLSDLGKHALQKSSQFYSTQPKEWHNHPLSAQKKLDDAAKTKAGLAAAQMMKFCGNSGHPGLKPGGAISVQGKSIFDQADESYGDYTVISVDHHCDGLGNYRNEFTAIPASVTLPPVEIYPTPYCDTQSALVTDNNDADRMGRIRVKFHWMKEGEKSPWLRVAGAYGGNEKGMYFMPETGEEVMIGFEGNDAAKPYMIGAVFNSKAKNKNGNADNDVKSIQTRSGNKIVLNDKDGSIELADAKGNSVLIDGSGNIKAEGSESITLTCGQAKIEMKKDGTININGKDITASATNNATVKGNTKALLGSGSASFTADGTKNEATMAGLKATVSGTTQANVTSLNTTISATVKVAAQAPMITLN